MYLVNRRRVSAPVLGLIDAAAEKAGYYPVPAYPVADSKVVTPAAQPEPQVHPDLDEDGELLIA
jgi:hypothetical protein